jgi:photosystem II stability/assembly factor-like uncharacterized protein
MYHNHSIRCSFAQPLAVALCLVVAVCAAAPKKSPPAPAPSASGKTSARIDSIASSTSTAEKTPDAKPATVVITAGKRGTWSGKQANVTTPINLIGSVGSDIYAAGNKTIFHSVNGGKEWLVQPVGFSGAAFWSFAADDVWIAGSQLAHSADQGKTWTVTSPFPKGVSVYGLWGPNPKELYAVGGGSGGTILYSKDSGKTFTKQAASTKGGWLYQVVGNGAEVFAVGKEDQGERSKAVLLATKDHGKNWKRLAPPKPKSEFETISHVCFSDTGKMYIATSYDVYATTDRGKNWQNLLTTENTEILAFACRGKELYVGGRNRSFHHSTDDGATWHDDELKPAFTGIAYASVQAVHITAQGDVFAGGEGEYKDHSGSLFRLNP